MKNFLLALVISWQGLYLSVEHTTLWNEPLKPGISGSVTALVGLGKVSIRGVYIHPVQRGGFGPLVQLGASVRIF